MTTTLTGRTHVYSDGAALVARCDGCTLSLRQVEGFDRDIALGTLLQHHPSAPEAVHRPAVPAGWRSIEPVA